MLNNNLLELVYEPQSATQFMEECPLTLGGLKNLFLETKDDKERYDNFLTKENLADEGCSLFRFLNDEGGMADSEVIEEILENEKDEYSIVFEDHNGRIDGYWKIYKVNRGKDE